MDSVAQRASDFFNDLLRNAQDALNKTIDQTLGEVAAERVEARTGVNPTFLAVSIAVLATFLLARK